MISVDDIDYSKHSNKKLLSLPVAMVIAVIVILVVFPIGLGFEFTGGVTAQITTDQSKTQVQQGFNEIEGLPTPDNVRTIPNGYVVRFQDLSSQKIDRLNDYVDSNYKNAAVSSVSPAYGRSLLQQSLWAVVWAFGIMTLVIFIFFRSFVPSIAVVLSAFSDMLIPLGVMDLLGIEVSLATIPALLLLIGYSIDSDILLTRRTLSGRRSRFYENVKKAMGTGITMTTTSMAAMFVMAVVSHMFGIFTLRDIGIILFVGLGIDLINTYMMNVALLRWHILGGKNDV
ncbi:MAG: protein translocase subunit SecF [Halobacteria archaeon]